MSYYQQYNISTVNNNLQVRWQEQEGEQNERGNEFGRNFKRRD